MTDDWTFEHVGEVLEYRYKGDIKATNKKTGTTLFIEVKNDSRIATTHNVLCEHENYYYDTGRVVPGNM